MPVEDSGNPALASDDFTLSSEMRQFAISMMQRRKQHQKSLQLAKRLQAKYPSDAPRVGFSIAKKFQQMVSSKIFTGAGRSLKQRPLQFAKAIPLQFVSYASDIATTETPYPKSFSQSPSKIKSVYPSQYLENIIDAKRNKKSLEERKLETRIERSSHLILDPYLRELLSRLLNIRIPNIRIYANELADSLVKKYDADALTYPNKILFRMDKYTPTKREGIALLGHELTHAAQLRMQDQNALENRDTQEREALLNERKILHYTSLPETNRDYRIFPNLSPVARYAENNQPAPAQAQPPRMASSLRDLSLPIETTTNLNPPFQLSEAQLSLIKEEVYRDLMHRIRVEFERGS